jgi:hypothetical protein
MHHFAAGGLGASLDGTFLVILLRLVDHQQQKGSERQPGGQHDARAAAAGTAGAATREPPSRGIGVLQHCFEVWRCIASAAVGLAD